MKVLIVDDEKIIRHGLVHDVPWSDYGIDPPFEARNGIDALELYHKEHPDILLTDIRMPLMDGISLTNEIRKLDSDIKIIYLTGYQDIEYIKNAFHNNAVDYILKPVILDELKAAIEKAVRLCTENAGLRRLWLHMEQKIQQSQPFFIRGFLSRLVEGSYNSVSEMEEKLRFWSIPLNIHEGYLALVVLLDEYETINTRDRELVSFGVENILQELLESGNGGYSFHLRDGNKFVCIVPYHSESRAELDKLLDSIRKALSVYLTQSVSVLVGSPVDGLFNINESYQNAIYLLLRRFYDEKAGIYYYDEEACVEADEVTIDKKLLADLCEQLRAHDESHFAQTAEKLLVDIRQKRYLCKEHLRGIFLFIAGHLIYSMPGDEVSRECIDLLTHCADKLYLCDTITSVHEIMAELMSELRRVLSQSQQDPGARIITEIKKILNSRLTENVTINDLSKQIFLTPQYICTIFKQRTGMTINEYITKQRVDKAKNMLLSGNYKLYEIAPMVGYKDVKYFSRVFKRATGVIPSEYTSE